MPTRVLPLIVGGFVCAVGGIVAFRLITGTIVTRGLITDSASRRVSALKLQLLLATVTGAVLYAAEIASHAQAGSLPPVDRDLLFTIGGSNGFMLSGLALNQLRAFFSSDSKQRGN